MNTERKKALAAEYKNRRPPMGILSIRCNATGDEFLVTAKDTNVGFNRHRFQLSAKMHPNKTLQSLWNEYGEGGFEYSVVEALEEKETLEKPNEKLEELLEKCLEKNPKTRRL